MRITIEDLEALKEMNDELEEGHVETEKQLQAELGGLRRIVDTVSTPADPSP
jgi:dynactin 1